MSITQARITTQLRTWVLIAGLSGLLVGIGAALGGKMLPIFVVITVVMNLVGYWFSDKIALMASRAQPLPDGEAPELRRIVDELSGLAGVPTPRLYLIPSEQPNAFATGRNPKHAAVAVTQGLLRTMPSDQIRGVLAHEFSHIRNRDILVSSIAAMIAGTIAAVANMLQWTLMFGGFSSEEEDNGPLGMIAMLATMLIAPIAAMVLQLAVSRQREYLADATAAKMLGTGKPLADALRTLGRATQVVPMDVNPATASLYITNPLRRQGVSALFSTHPPLEERIRRLEAYDAAMGIHNG